MLEDANEDLIILYQKIKKEYLNDFCVTKDIALYKILTLNNRRTFMDSKHKTKQKQSIVSYHGLEILLMCACICAIGFWRSCCMSAASLLLKGEPSAVESI